MMGVGVQGFVDAMAGLGLNPRIEAELVIYEIEPVEGVHAGTKVETGVTVGELASWPQAPPHWVHLSSSVVFSNTNSQPSSRDGWKMHSRQISGWGDAPPGVTWASHIRAVLGEATE